MYSYIILYIISWYCPSRYSWQPPWCLFSIYSWSIRDSEALIWLNELHSSNIVVELDARLVFSASNHLALDYSSLRLITKKCKNMTIYYNVLFFFVHRSTNQTVYALIWANWFYNWFWKQSFTFFLIYV